MSLSNHLIELKKKHLLLGMRIKEMQLSPGSDYLKITQLKKQKLQLKEQIARLNGYKSIDIAA